MNMKTHDNKMLLLQYQSYEAKSISTEMHLNAAIYL